MGEKAQFILCIQESKGENEHFELISDEVSASIRDF